MSNCLQSTTPEARLAELGLQLPPAPSPVANYVAYRLEGTTLYVSGQVPKSAEAETLTGRLGDDLSVEAGYSHARNCALQVMAVAQRAVGDLSRLSLIKVVGMVRSTPDFGEHPQVVDGASDLLTAVFGADGLHARSAFGVASLPRRSSVEIEAIFHVR